MSTRTTTPTGAPTWMDLTTSDQPRSLAFYTDLFGWTAEEPNAEMGGYSNFRRDGALVAGCMPATLGMPDAWTVHFASTDAEKTAELAGSHGGAVHAAAMQVMDLGHGAWLGDPGGASFGVWQAGTHGGFTVLDEPGAPSWFELHTRDYDAVLAFYRDVLGWQTTTMADAPDFRYTVAVAGGEQLAGVMDGRGFLPEGAPSQWAVYINVDDVDATVAQALALGATVVDPAIDTPYGRMATLADPTGAAIKLRQPPEH